MRREMGPGTGGGVVVREAGGTMQPRVMPVRGGEWVGGVGVVVGVGGEEGMTGGEVEEGCSGGGGVEGQGRFVPGSREEGANEGWVGGGGGGRGSWGGAEEEEGRGGPGENLAGERGEGSAMGL